MAQTLLKYVGSAECKSGTTYLGSAFTLGNVMKMKSEGVRVGISGMPAFLTSFDDEAYLDVTADYTFDKDCVIAFCEVVEVI